MANKKSLIPAAAAVAPKPSAKRKSRLRGKQRISGELARRRLRQMAEKTGEDVRMALQFEAAMEAANDTLRSAGKHRGNGAHTTNTIRLALAVQVSLVVARLFDKGSARWAHNAKDISSIPLMIRLLRQDRCRRSMLVAASKWPGQALTGEAACQAAIDQARGLYRRLAQHPYLLALRRVKSYRNNATAHTMREKKAIVPRFKDLTLLVDLARDITAAVDLAVLGHTSALLESERQYRADGEVFWRRALGQGAPK